MRSAASSRSSTRCSRCSPPSAADAHRPNEGTRSTSPPLAAVQGENRVHRERKFVHVDPRETCLPHPRRQGWILRRASEGSRAVSIGSSWRASSRMGVVFSQPTLAGGRRRSRWPDWRSAPWWGACPSRPRRAITVGWSCSLRSGPSPRAAGVRARRFTRWEKEGGAPASAGAGSLLRFRAGGSSPARRCTPSRERE